MVVTRCHASVLSVGHRSNSLCLGRTYIRCSIVRSWTRPRWEDRVDALRMSSILHCLGGLPYLPSAEMEDAG